MKLIIYDDPGTAPKVFENLLTDEQIAKTVRDNTMYEDAVFAVLDDDGNILERHFYDFWKNREEGD